MCGMCVCVRVHIHMCRCLLQYTCEVKGWFAGIISFLLPCGFWDQTQVLLDLRTGTLTCHLICRLASSGDGSLTGRVLGVQIIRR